MTNYEAPELLEIGSSESLILGEKETPPEDTSGDTSKRPIGSFLDQDE